MKYIGDASLLYWLLKCKYQDPTRMLYKTKINLQLTQNSAVCFACSKQKLGILIDIQDLYQSKTPSDTLSATHCLNIKILLGYVFLSWVGPESLRWEIGTLLMRYYSDESLEPLTNLNYLIFIRPFSQTFKLSLKAMHPYYSTAV